MPRDKKVGRFPLNAYLLRGNAKEALRFVDISDFSHQLPIDIGDQRTANLYYGRNSNMPDWLAVLAMSAKEAPNLENMWSASISGILLAEIQERLFALTFGHAWQRVNQGGVEPNFGIRCVLNLAEEKSLRAIRRDRVAEESIQAIEQIPDSDDIYRFGMDLEKDLLRGVKARISEDLNFGVWVAGGDSFRGSIDLHNETIASYLKRCLDLYSIDSYRKKFSWVDNISPVRNEDLIVKLDEELASSMASSRSAFTLCVPALLSWDDHDFFSFERKKRGQEACANHLEYSQWMSFVKLKGISIDANALATNYVYAYRQGGVVSDSWPVRDCVHGLISFSSRDYLIHAGHWFELNPDFVALTNEKISKITQPSIELPPVGLKEKEGDYNLRVSATPNHECLLLDKKLIWHGGGASRIEVCDLFTEDGHLICVKSWGGASGSLSHLFLQAKNSIQLINNDAVYCEKVANYIDNKNSSYSLSWEYVCRNPDGAEVVLAVMRGCSKEDLPFFAKLSLVDCVTELRKMRFKATYLPIGVA